MRIGFYQFAPRFGETQLNLEHLASALVGLEANLLVLPELANSGYLFVNQAEVERLSEPIPGTSTDFLIELSKRHQTYFSMGLPERDGNVFYNSSVLVGPKGVIGVYRKTHLFYEEKLYFQPGDLGFPVWDVDGVKVGMLVCFDHYFPEAARSLALEGAQVICHPSNLVLPTKAQWSTRVRAMENKLFWIMCNRFGTEDRGEKSLAYTGESQIVGPNGDLLATAPKSGNCLQVVDVDPSEASNKDVTSLNNLFEDRRPDTYRL